jgi:hypothetical protein
MWVGISISHGQFRPSTFKLLPLPRLTLILSIYTSLCLVTLHSSNLAFSNHSRPHFCSTSDLLSDTSLQFAMPTKKGSPGKGRNVWNHEQRVCLDILWHLPNGPSPNERARAFNVIFRDHQLACGVLDGLTYKTLSIQYYESTKRGNSTWKRIWGPICAIPKQDTVLRDQLGRKIEQVLMSSNTSQVPTGPTTPPATPPERSDTIHCSSGGNAGKPQRYREHQLATPGPSTRKRPATTSDIPLVFDENEEDEDYEPEPKRARRNLSPTVVLPPMPQQRTVATPRTNVSKSGKSPKTKHRTGGRPGAIYPFPRPNGSTLMLYEKEFIEAQQDLQIIDESAAHPKTGPSLVFRYWDNKSHGQ